MYRPAHADGEGGHHVEAPIPAMEYRKALADLRNQLKPSGQDDDDRREKMCSATAKFPSVSPGTYP